MEPMIPPFPRDDNDSPFGPAQSPVPVDDSDPTITYNSMWELSGNPLHEYNGTIHGTRTPGASFSYTFNGTLIQVWGTASNTAGRLKLTYEIDDSTPDIRFISTVPDVTYNALFFERTNLNEGVHILKVTYGDQGNISGDHMFWLDYLQYGHTAHNTPSNDLAVSAASGTRLPTPVLVGIIISCVAAQFLATLSAYLFWRRCRRRHPTPPTASSEPGIPSPMSQTHPYHTRGPTSLPLCSEISSTAAPIPDALPSSSATSLLPHSAASATLAAVPTADDFAVQPAPTRPRLVVMNKHGVYIGRTPSIRKAARATSGMSSIVFAYSDPYKLSASPPRLAVPVSPSIGGASEGWMVGSSSAYSELQLDK